MKLSGQLNVDLSIGGKGPTNKRRKPFLFKYDQNEAGVHHKQQ